MTNPATHSPQAFVDYLSSHLPAVEAALAAASATPLTDAPTNSAGEKPATAASAPSVEASAPADDLTCYLYEPLTHFTSSGGKRVRPVLALLGAEAVGGRAEDALSTGVAIELFQSAALIHDDIADRSELRRGEPCLYRTQGTGLAINDGDLALVRVIEVVLEDTSLDEARKLRVIQELVSMERHTLEGQALDLGWVRDGRWDITSNDYLYMVESKTAWYSAAIPLKAGAIAGGGSEQAADGLAEVGMLAGVAFQLTDDLLNLVGDAAAQGKDFRSDITEGKRTLAVVWALEHLNEADRTELVGLLTSSTTNVDELARAVELLEEGGGIERCRALARERADAACERAQALAREELITPQACELLCSMSDFFVERAG